MRQNTLMYDLLKCSTWKVFFLGMFTWCVYYGHYIRQQSYILNAYLPEDKQFGGIYINSIFVLGYLRLVLTVLSIITEISIIDAVGDLVELVWGVALMRWGYLARNHMHVLLQIHPRSVHWSNGFMAVLFAPLYFNFKVNQLSESV